MGSRSTVHALRLRRAAWCLFDFANSSFPTVALTAFGSAYFQGVLARDGVALGSLRLGPSSAWGAAISLSFLAVTLTAPVLGALADRGGARRRFLALYVALCVGATTALAWVPPGAGWLAFGLYVLANFAFEGAYVFYNAFLPSLAPPDRLGRLSGLGWALGYVGGLGCLLLALPLVPKHYDAAGASAASTVYLLVAAWYLLFSLPALVLLKDTKPSTTSETDPDAGTSSTPPGGLRAAWREVLGTLRSLPQHPSLLFFLLAYLLYNDGVTTVIEFTGIYTKEVLHFGPAENVTLFVLLNVVAAPGAYAFGHLLDRIGARRAISATLLVWVLVVVLAAQVQSKAGFWPVGALAALVLGATQACSRVLMAQLAPAERSAEYMGLLALSGKASAVMGPLLYGLVADLSARPGNPASGHRTAILALGLLFAGAWLLLRRVRVR